MKHHFVFVIVFIRILWMQSALVTPTLHGTKKKSRNVRKFEIVENTIRSFQTFNDSLVHGLEHWSCIGWQKNQCYATDVLNVWMSRTIVNYHANLSLWKFRFNSRSHSLNKMVFMQLFCCDLYLHDTEVTLFLKTP